MRSGAAVTRGGGHSASGTHDARGEDGFVAGAESLVLGVLVFVVGTLVLLNAWSVVDAAMAAESAAREAARAVVEAAPVDGGAAPLQDHYTAVARDAALRSLAGSRPGLGAAEGGAPLLSGPPLVEGSLDRGACVRVTIRFEVPVVALPLVGGRGGVRTVTGTHLERVDPYRAGLAGPAGQVRTCA